MPTKALLLLLLAVGRSACFIASSPWASRAPKVLLTPRTPSPPQLQLADGPQELPSKELLKAIATCKGTATAADISAASSLDIGEARRQLLVLARLVGAELQVSEDGELLFVFDEPGCCAASVHPRCARGCATRGPRHRRRSFGCCARALVSASSPSITITTAAIAALSSSSKDDRSSSSSSMGTSVARLWGPSPFDFLYYSTRPYGYYGYYEPTGEKGFLQSCFSLLFGDGNPNHALEQRTAAATAALIRANGGAVTAEQLAPLLAPDLDPEIVEEELNRPGAPLREDWVLPVLLQFGGEPVVTEDGDLIYIFPELMATRRTAARAAGGAAAAARHIARWSIGVRPLDYAALAAFAERAMAWRPAVGDRVVIGAVARGRVGATTSAAASYTGQSASSSRTTVTACRLASTLTAAGARPPSTRSTSTRIGRRRRRPRTPRASAARSRRRRPRSSRSRAARSGQPLRRPLPRPDARRGGGLPGGGAWLVRPAHRRAA